jgi:hypothetical protein
MMTIQQPILSIYSRNYCYFILFHIVKENNMNTNNYIFETIIWNKGDKPEKSLKRIIPKQIVDESPSSSSPIIPSSIYRESNNKRQESSNKISERYLIEQRGQNPYISHTSYVNDIETQQSFLIPKSSNEHPKGRVDFKPN